MNWHRILLNFYILLSLVFETNGYPISVQAFFSKIFSSSCTLHFHENCYYDEIDRHQVARESQLISFLLPNLNTVNIQSCRDHVGQWRSNPNVQVFPAPAKLFNRSRYHETCLAHIRFPVFTESKLNYFPESFIWFQIRQTEGRLPSFEFMVPTYVFGLLTEPLVLSPAAYIPHQFSAVRLILLSLANNSVLQIQAIHLGMYTSTAFWKTFRFTSDTPEWNEKYTSVEFVKLDLTTGQFETKQNFDRIFLKQNPPHSFSLSSTTKKLSFVYLKTKNCVPAKNNNYLAKIKIETDRYFINEQECVLGIYAETSNCTFKSCFRNMDARLFFQLMFNIDTEGYSNVKVLSAGGHTEQMNFFVLLGTHETKGSMSLATLLSPFPFNVWMHLLVLYLLTCSIFLASTRSFSKVNQLVFWLFSVHVEQDVSVKDTGKHWPVVGITTFWVAGTFILRLMYTGDVYGGLAQGNVPENVPTMFEHIFNHSNRIYQLNKPMNYLAGHDAGNNLINALLTMSPSNRARKHFSVIRDHLQYAPFEIATALNISEGKHVDCFVRGSDIKLKQCPTERRIALIHSSVSYTEGNDIAYFKSYFKADGKRQVVENHSQASFLTNFKFWVVYEDMHGTLVKNFEKFSANLYASGIFDLMVQISKKLRENNIRRSIESEAFCKTSTAGNTSSTCRQRNLFNNKIMERIKLKDILPVFVASSSLLITSFVVVLVEKYWNFQLQFYNM